MPNIRLKLTNAKCLLLAGSLFALLTACGGGVDSARDTFASGGASTPVPTPPPAPVQSYGITVSATYLTSSADYVDISIAANGITSPTLHLTAAAPKQPVFQMPSGTPFTATIASQSVAGRVCTLNPSNGTVVADTTISVDCLIRGARSGPALAVLDLEDQGGMKPLTANTGALDGLPSGSQIVSISLVPELSQTSATNVTPTCDSSGTCSLASYKVEVDSEMDTLVFNIQVASPGYAETLTRQQTWHVTPTI